MSKIETFGQKSKLLSKIETFVKNWTFCQKSKLLWKTEIFCQKSKLLANHFHSFLFIYLGFGKKCLKKLKLKKWSKKIAKIKSVLLHFAYPYQYPCMGHADVCVSVSPVSVFFEGLKIFNSFFKEKKCWGLNQEFSRIWWKTYIFFCYFYHCFYKVCFRMI